MKNLFIASLLFIIGFSACNSSTTGLFGKKTPSEKYEDKLQETGLTKTPEGRQWLAASDAALQQTNNIQLPYKQTGNFPAGKARALGLQFTAKPGERLTFIISKKAVSNLSLFAELYQQNSSEKPDLLHAADTTASEFTYDVKENGSFILKLQPQLFQWGGYDLSITVGPSLGFPVSYAKATIGSFWGADRDGGKRSHEGIDIFAPKGSPAIAAANGYITGVREGGIGGKTVWLRPDGQNYTLYYAHLDAQLVQPGQQVRRGDTVGLVGNTGNAKYTPSHLHFGVYSYSGAIDPLPFVNREVKSGTSPSQKSLGNFVRLAKDYKTFSTTFKKGTILIPVALNAKEYIAELPDGQMIQLPSIAVQLVSQPLKGSKALVSTALLKNLSGAASTTIITQGAPVAILGYFNEYALIKSGDAEGWIIASALKG